MRKIMFNDKYGLTQAVLSGRKTMTRRIKSANSKPYQIEEVVAIAQSYKSVYEELEEKKGNSKANEWWCDLYERIGDPTKHAGYRNKMFVRADLMPHRIKITGAKLERLQDISEEDIYKEGFEKQSVNNGWGNAAWHWEAMLTYMDDLGLYKEIRSTNPQEAFECLIDKLSGYGTWDSNPCVYAYEFELQH